MKGLHLPEVSSLRDYDQRRAWRCACREILSACAPESEALSPCGEAARRRTPNPMVSRGRTPSPRVHCRHYNFRVQVAPALVRASPEEATMQLRSRLYNVFFRRTSTFALTIVLGALVFERAFDQGADALYERLNHGVRSR
ncbi:Cytochrome b-c1 complex subunit 9 [Platysternon megacephalum]|uniref:Cytochrome b-c1 complex subunit 9 n=1 Tax=Platysternon megacephalum TaxID=55544 RepID=A0A4D9DTY9_9SAUR|nr:Cytochrome b-c1 complex subunit 9 [Platysternon megacephalum]